MSTLSHIRAKKTAPWSRLVALIKDPNPLILAVFCTIGLLVSLNVMLRFPDFAAIIEQLN